MKGNMMALFKSLMRTPREAGVGQLISVFCIAQKSNLRQIRKNFIPIRHANID